MHGVDGTSEGGGGHGNGERHYSGNMFEKKLWYSLKYDRQLLVEDDGDINLNMISRVMMGMTIITNCSLGCVRSLS